LVEEGRQARLETSAGTAPAVTVVGGCQIGPFLGWSWAAARVPARRSPSRMLAALAPLRGGLRPSL